MSSTQDTAPRAVERALAAMAVGRIVLGAATLLSPRAGARAFGMSAAVTPELEYMARIFGIRAVALGTGYLSTAGEARRRWQRLAFMCDLSDTITGGAHLRRGDLPRWTALSLTGLTGTYAAWGAARVAAEGLGASRERPLSG